MAHLLICIKYCSVIVDELFIFVSSLQSKLHTVHDVWIRNLDSLCSQHSVLTIGLRFPLCCFYLCRFYCESELPEYSLGKRGNARWVYIHITQCEYTCTCAVVMKWITDLKEEEKNWLYIFKMCSNLIKLDFNKQNG